MRMETWLKGVPSFRARLESKRDTTDRLEVNWGAMGAMMVKERVRLLREWKVVSWSRCSCGCFLHG